MKPLAIFETVEQLVNKAVRARLIGEEDRVYARNQVLSLLHLDEFHEPEEGGVDQDIPDLLGMLVDYACEKGIIQDVLDEKDIFASHIMNVFTPRPSTVNHIFREKYAESPAEATDYFYALSKHSNYIQTKQIAKNIVYKTPTEYGDLDITINLSKPEKDPKSIAREKNAKKGHYPKCLLCMENEGYAGRTGHPARSNHRLIRLTLGGEPWYLQYSPYVYYNEHCIVLSETHRDMKIDKAAFQRLLEFVGRFPHYFLGSNADLPIVGGSILSHDHYQGGRYEFAMAKAADDWQFEMKAFPDVEAAVIKWPMSVIRLRSAEAARLTEAADHILQIWKHYSDPSADILAETNGTPHNTITPIARKRAGRFELDLVLRNNRTSETHPLGIFHPHAEVHHIKKENIGLIEVMGLAVLPARLKNELAEVEKFLLGHSNDIADYHLDWANGLKKKYEGTVTAENVEGIVRNEVGKVFLQVLQHAGVFKRDEKGKQAFRNFLRKL